MSPELLSLISLICTFIVTGGIVIAIVYFAWNGVAKYRAAHPSLRNRVAEMEEQIKNLSMNTKAAVPAK